MVGECVEALGCLDIPVNNARIPASRWGESEDLKGAVVFLASDAADYVHGATLLVNWGRLGR